MELITIQANVLLVCTSKCTQADVHCRPWEYEPGNRTQVHLLLMKGQPNSDRDATFQYLCVSEPVKKAESVREWHKIQKFIV